MFTIVMGQCDEPMQNRVESANEYEDAEIENDVVALLKIIKNVMTGTNDMKYPSMQAVKAWKKLAKAWQNEEETLLDYYKRFTGLVDVYVITFLMIFSNVTTSLSISASSLCFALAHHTVPSLL